MSQKNAALGTVFQLEYFLVFFTVQFFVLIKSVINELV